MSAIPILDHREAIAQLRTLVDRYESETAMCRAIAQASQRTSFPQYGVIQTLVEHQSTKTGTGDVFDVVRTIDGRLIVYLADCAGPNTPSGCLIGLAIRNAIHTASLEDRVLAGAVLNECNRHLLDMRSTIPQLAVAMALVIIDQPSHPTTFQLARGGLPRVSLNESSLSLPGMLLGFSKMDYSTETISWPANQKLIMATAGNTTITLESDTASIRASSA